MLIQPVSKGEAMLEKAEKKRKKPLLENGEESKEVTTKQLAIEPGMGPYRILNREKSKEEN